MKKVVNGLLVVAIFAALIAYKMGLFHSLLNGLNSQDTTPLLSQEDTAIVTKMEPFITCINGVDNTWRSSYARYHETYEAQVGNARMVVWNLLTKFTLKHGHDDPYTGVLSCAEGLETIIKTEPADAELDKAGADYAQTLRQLLPLVKEVDTYYAQHDYEDDKMAKGKALQAQIEPLFQNLFATSDNIHTIVAARNLSLQRKALEAMEQRNGKDAWWHIENVMLEARLAADGIEALIQQNRATTENIQAIETTYQQAYDAAKAYADSHPDEIRPDKQTQRGIDPFWPQLNTWAFDMLGSIKEVRRNIDGTQSLERSYGSMIHNFNRLVEQYNRSNATRNSYIDSMNR